VDRDNFIFCMKFNRTVMQAVFVVFHSTAPWYLHIITSRCRIISL
jgi:hypothetical protein